MARTGSFGRLPRSQPSLASTLIALAREQQSQRDQNILDAWKNGGQYEGKKVTDAMILAYWNKRMNGISKDDPLYDTYKNNVTQLTYQVEQSKEELAWTQGKKSDTQYAQFFLKWSKKAPKDSQFWRTLQEDAAKLIQSAKDKARAAGANAKVKAYNAFVDGITKKSVFLGESMNEALKSVAAQHGMNLQTQGDAVISILNAEMISNPDKYKELRDSLKVAGYSGPITSDYYGQVLRATSAAYASLADRSYKDGYLSNYDAYTKKESDIAVAAIDSKTWDVSEAYAAAEATFNKTWGNDSSTQDEKTAASKAFAAVIHKLKGTKGLDAGSIAELDGDETALLGGQASGVSFGEAHGVGVSSGQTSAKNRDEWASKNNLYNLTGAAAKANPQAFVTAPMKIGADGVPHFDPTSKSLGVVDRTELPPDATAVVIPTAAGPTLAYVPTHTLFVKNPAGGPDVAIGKVITYGSGGAVTTQVQHRLKDGTMVWTSMDTHPLADGAGYSVNDKGDVVITLSASVAGSTPTAEQTKAVGAMAQQVSANPAGKYTQAYGDAGSLRYDNGQYFWDTKNKDAGSTSSIELSVGTGGISAFSVDDLRNAAFDPSREQQAVPGRDFKTAIGASTASGENSLTTAQLSDLRHNALYTEALANQAIQSAGLSPADPASISDPRVASAVSEVVTNLGNHLSTPPQYPPIWRDHIADPFAPVVTNSQPGQAAWPANVPLPSIKLPGVPGREPDSAHEPYAGTGLSIGNPTGFPPALAPIKVPQAPAVVTPMYTGPIGPSASGGMLPGQLTSAPSTPTQKKKAF